jgi:hypothetical protein
MSPISFASSAEAISHIDGYETDHLSFEINPRLIETLLKTIEVKQTIQIPNISIKQSIKIPTLDLPKEQIAILETLFSTKISEQLDLALTVDSPKIEFQAKVRNFRWKTGKVPGSALHVLFDLEVDPINAVTDVVEICSSDKCTNPKDKVILNQLKAQSTGKLIVNASIKISHSNGTISVNSPTIQTNIGLTGGPSVSIKMGKIELPPVALNIGDARMALDLEPIADLIRKRLPEIANEQIKFHVSAINQELVSRTQMLLDTFSYQTSFKGSYQSEPKPLPADYWNNWNLSEFWSRNSKKEIITKGIKERVQSLTYSIGLRELKVLESGNLKGVSSVPELVANNKEYLPTSQSGNWLASTKSTLNKGFYRDTGSVNFDEVATNFVPDVSLSISEPFINSVLNALEGLGLPQYLVENLEGTEGIAVSYPNLRFHIHPEFKTISLIANVYIDLTKVQTGFPKLQQAGVFGLKMLANETHLKIPLEFIFAPSISKDTKGVFTADAKLLHAVVIKKPDEKPWLINNFEYENTLKSSILEAVEGQILNEVAKSLSSLTDTPLRMTLNSLINRPGLEWSDLKLGATTTGHLILKGKVKKIDVPQLR